MLKSLSLRALSLGGRGAQRWNCEAEGLPHGTSFALRKGEETERRDEKRGKRGKRGKRRGKREVREEVREVVREEVREIFQCRISWSLAAPKTGDGFAPFIHCSKDRPAVYSSEIFGNQNSDPIHFVCVVYLPGAINECVRPI